MKKLSKAVLLFVTAFAFSLNSFALSYKNEINSLIERQNTLIKSFREQGNEIYQYQLVLRNILVSLNDLNAHIRFENPAARNLETITDDKNHAQLVLQKLPFFRAEILRNFGEATQQMAQQPETLMALLALQSKVEKYLAEQKLRFENRLAMSTLYQEKWRQWQQNTAENSEKIKQNFLANLIQLNSELANVSNLLKQSRVQFYNELSASNTTNAENILLAHTWILAQVSPIFSQRTLNPDYNSRYQALIDYQGTELQKMQQALEEARKIPEGIEDLPDLYDWGNSLFKQNFRKLPFLRQSFKKAESAGKGGSTKGSNPTPTPVPAPVPVVNDPAKAKNQPQPRPQSSSSEAKSTETYKMDVQVVVDDVNTRVTFETKDRECFDKKVQEVHNFLTNLQDKLSKNSALAAKSSFKSDQDSVFINIDNSKLSYAIGFNSSSALEKQVLDDVHKKMAEREGRSNSPHQKLDISGNASLLARNIEQSIAQASHIVERNELQKVRDEAIRLANAQNYFDQSIDEQLDVADELISKIEQAGADANSTEPYGDFKDPQAQADDRMTNTDLLKTVVDVGIGFVPVLGDMYDLGNFLSAMALNQTLMGNKTGSMEKIVLGLALILPGGSIPNAAKNTQILKDLAGSLKDLPPGHLLPKSQISSVLRSEQEALTEVIKLNAHLSSASIAALKAITSQATIESPELIKTLTQTPKLLEKITKLGSHVTHTKLSSSAKYNARFSIAPAKAGTSVVSIKTTQTTKFYRAFSKKGAKSSEWIGDPTDYLDANGKILSGPQIKDKFNLPGLPYALCEVTLPSGTSLEASVIGKNSFGNSEGEIQFEILGELNKDWFGKEIEL